jgi:hypothetical protein
MDFVGTLLSPSEFSSEPSGSRRSPSTGQGHPTSVLVLGDIELYLEATLGNGRCSYCPGHCNAVNSHYVLRDKGTR